MSNGVETLHEHAASSDLPEVEPTLTMMSGSLLTARREQRREKIVIRIWQVAILVAFFGGWEWASRGGLLPHSTIFFGRPSGVAEFLWQQRAVLWANLLSTLEAAGAGFLIGTVGAILCGILLAQVHILDRIFDPFMVVLAGVPRIALAPLFVLWFGITVTAKIALSVSLVFFVVLFNMRAGIQSVDGDLITMSRALGANRRRIFRSVIMPACVPTLFAGFRLAIVFSVLGVIASEMTAARSGLGMQVVAYSQNLQPDGVFAVLTLLAIVMALLNGVLQLIERRLLRWVPS